MTVFAQEQYGFPGCPRTYFRVGERQWIEFINNDNAVSRIYYDAASWGQSLDIDREAYDDKTEWFAEAVENAKKLERMTPAQCRWLAFLVTLIFCVLIIPVALCAICSSSGRVDMKIMCKDLKTLWSGREPIAFGVVD